MTTAALGSQAPGFTLNGVDGRTYSLDQALAQGPLLLVFIKSGCPACDLALPYLSRLRQAYPGGWTLWAISQDPLGRSQEYAQRFDLPFPVLVDEAGYPVSKAYDPPATPTLFLIEANGRVTYSNHGFSKDDINQVSRLIADRLQVEARVIAQPDDGRPPFRPG